jgi:hypothetical protein
MRRRFIPGSRDSRRLKPELFEIDLSVTLLKNVLFLLNGRAARCTTHWGSVMEVW